MRIHTIDVDLKHDRRSRLGHDHVLDFSALDCSLISVPLGIDISSWVHIVTFLFLEIFFGLELQRSAFAPALEALLRHTKNPSLLDLQEEIRKNKSEPARLAAARLDAIRIASPLHFTSRRNLWRELQEQSIYIGIDGPFLPAHRFLVWLLIYVRWSLLLLANNRRPDTVVILDEGDTSLHVNAPASPTGAPSIAVNALLRMREAGITFWVGSPTWDLASAALANFPNIVALRPNAAEAGRAARALHLDERQLRYLLTMPLGTALGSFRRADHHVIFTFRKSTTTKDATADVLHRARARTREFCNRATQDHQQAVVHSPAEEHRPAPIVEPATAHTPPTPIALNEHTTKLLADIAAHPFTLCTPSYRRCGLLLAQGDRARSQGERLGLLLASRVTTGRGRGKTGIALSLTPAGLRWLEES
jgi:hypothetical protein